MKHFEEQRKDDCSKPQLFSNAIIKFDYYLNALHSHSTVDSRQKRLLDQSLYLISRMTFFFGISPVKYSILRGKINLDSLGLCIKSSLELILQYDYP